MPRVLSEAAARETWVVLPSPLSVAVGDRDVLLLLLFLSFFLRLFPRLLAVLAASRSELGVVRPFVVIFSEK